VYLFYSEDTEDIMKLYCDGALTRICYKYEDCQPIILDLPKPVTNNVGEYLAIIAGLESAIRMHRRVITVLSDSQLVVRQLNKEYKIKKPHLALLAQKVMRLAGQLNDVKFEWICREKNEAGIALEN